MLTIYLPSGTLGHEQHKIRREAISPHFFKQSIYRLEPILTAQIGQLSSHLKNFVGTGEVLDVRTTYIALMTDVMPTYMRNRSFNYLDTPNFSPERSQMFIEMIRTSMTAAHLPVYDRIQTLPHLGFAKSCTKNSAYDEVLSGSFSALLVMLFANVPS